MPTEITMSNGQRFRVDMSPSEFTQQVKLVDPEWQFLQKGEGVGFPTHLNPAAIAYVVEIFSMDVGR